MSFNYGQYIKSSSGVYISEVTLSDIHSENQYHYYYSGLNISNPNSYYIVLSLNAILDNARGSLYIKYGNDDTEITIYNFNIPIVEIPIEGRKYSSLSDMQAAWQNDDIEDGKFCLINNSSSSQYGNIYVKPSLTAIGNINGTTGFPSLKIGNVEKIFTLRTQEPITTIGYRFINLNDSSNYQYTGCGLQVFTLQELMGNNDYIPHTKIRHLGIQGKPGMKYCINGDELQLTSSGVEEHFSYSEDNPIFSIKVVPKNAPFLIDYEYIE